jgi:sugar phosphate isomerase/epimerase
MMTVKEGAYFMHTRRDFVRLALGAAPVLGLARNDSEVNGVILGAQSYSFRDRPLDGCIQGLQQVGITYVELWSGHVEPRAESGKEGREQQRKWRTSVSMDHFKQVREKFKNAGIKLYAYNYSFRDDFTDEEIARGFEMAKALGVKYLTASSNVSTAKRIDAWARKAKITVGMHNHSRIRPNEFARPQDFEDALRGMSNYIGINLDIGHFWGAGFDPVAFLDQHHDRIVTLHIKDKTKANDENQPFGKGDTPIKEVLQLLKRKKLKIPANIEYEYKGGDTVEEVRKCFEYCKQAINESPTRARA